MGWLEGKKQADERKRHGHGCWFLARHTRSYVGKLRAARLLLLGSLLLLLLRCTGLANALVPLVGACSAESRKCIEFSLLCGNFSGSLGRVGIGEGKGCTGEGSFELLGLETYEER